MNKEFKEFQANPKITPFYRTDEYYFTRGMAAYEKGNLSTAEKFLIRAVELAGDEAGASYAYQLAVLYADLGEYFESNDILMEILENPHTQLDECHYLLAKNYFELDFLVPAHDHANYYLQSGEDDLLVAEMLDLIKELDEEMDAMYDEEEDIGYFHSEALSLLSQGEAEGAVEILEELTLDHPKYMPIFNSLSLAYLHTEQIDKSIKTIEHVLRQDEANLQALCNKILILSFMNDHLEAEGIANTLVKVKPFLQEDRLKLGTTFAVIGYYNEAYDLLINLIDEAFTKANKIILYKSLARSAYFIDKKTTANNIWKRLIQLDENQVEEEPWK